MFLYEYIIKLLMGNSGSLFLGLLVVVFGYYGWLLWHINERTEDISFSLKLLTDKVEDLAVTQKEDKRILIDIIKEETDEVKDMMVVLNGARKKLNKQKEFIDKNKYDQLDFRRYKCEDFLG